MTLIAMIISIILASPAWSSGPPKNGVIGNASTGAVIEPTPGCAANQVLTEGATADTTTECSDATIDVDGNATFKSVIVTDPQEYELGEFYLSSGSPGAESCMGRAVTGPASTCANDGTGSSNAWVAYAGELVEFIIINGDAMTTTDGCNLKIQKVTGASTESDIQTISVPPSNAQRAAATETIVAASANSLAAGDRIHIEVTDGTFCADGAGCTCVSGDDLRVKVIANR